MSRKTMNNLELLVRYTIYYCISLSAAGIQNIFSVILNPISVIARTLSVVEGDEAISRLFNLEILRSLCSLRMTQEGFIRLTKKTLVMMLMALIIFTSSGLYLLFTLPKSASAAWPPARRAYGPEGLMIDGVIDK